MIYLVRELRYTIYDVITGFFKTSIIWSQRVKKKKKNLIQAINHKWMRPDLCSLLNFPKSVARMTIISRSHHLWRTLKVTGRSSRGRQMQARGWYKPVMSQCGLHTLRTHHVHVSNPRQQKIRPRLQKNSKEPHCSESVLWGLHNVKATTCFKK